MSRAVDRLTTAAAFVRIVELGSFTAAARDLGLRQATVSRWIATLEDELGVRLLDRTTRAVRVTEAGERFIADARALVEVWDGAVERAARRTQRLAGRLRVSLPVVFGERFVTPHLAAWAARHPSLAVELVFSDRYVDLVEAGVDLAVRVGRPVDSAYRARNLGATPRRLVAAPSYLTGHPAPTRPSDLAAHACLLHSGLDNRAVWTFDGPEGVAGVEVRGRLAANHSDTLRQLALGGLGVALLASWLVDDDLAAGRLVALLPRYAAPPAAVQVLYASPRHAPRAVTAFVDFLAETLAPILG